MLQPSIQPNDKLAKRVIWILSFFLFIAIVALDRKTIQPSYPFSFDVHYFAFANSIINSGVAILLVAALVAVKKKNIILHKKLMLGALLLSVLFLISYVLHHLFAGDTKYGGDGVIRYFYYFILITHIVLAAVIMPFILFTAYRGLSGSYAKHKKLARITWPLWFYVSITGVLIYWMISPYY